MTSVTVLSGRERRRRWTRPRSCGSLRRACRLASALWNLRGGEMFTPTWFIRGGGKRGWASCRALDGEARFARLRGCAGCHAADRERSERRGVIEVVLRNGRVLRLSET